MLAKSRKILHVITGLTTGGAETMLFKLLSGSTDEAMVVCLGREMETDISIKIRGMGFPVIWLDMKGQVGNIVRNRRLLFQMRKYAPDVIQGWMYHGNIVASILGWMLNAPVVWGIRHSLHDLKNDKWLTRKIVWLNAVLSNSPEFIVYNSHTSSEQHHAYGFKNRGAKIIPNGFDLSVFSPTSEKHLDIRRKLNLDTESFVIGCVARYHPTKGHEVFFNAAVRLLRDMPETNVRFLLVGKGLDRANGPLVNMLENMGILKNSVLLGERSDVNELTMVFDVATSASHSEAFSNAIGEAMACGVPCVATDVGDSARLVDDTGIIVPAGDAEAMARAWRHLITMRPDDFRKLGEKARKRMVDTYSLDRAVSEFHFIYESALSSFLANNP